MSDTNGWDTADIEDADDMVTPEPESRYATVDDMMSPPPPPTPEVETVPDSPDRSSVLEPRKRKPRAVTYERMIRKTIGGVIRELIQRPSTVPDAATLIEYGPELAAAYGDLAAENDSFAKFIGVVDDVFDNANIRAIYATSKIATQIARNHEPVLEPKRRTLRIPGIKREWTLPKIGIRLGLFRGATHDPDALCNAVLTDPDVVAALKKNGIRIVDNSPG